MDEPLAARARVAVVGLGRIGRLHAMNLAGRVPSAELAAAVDADTNAAREVGEALGVPWYAALEDALGDADLDGVVVAAPTALHPELVEAAAAAGKHVLCEKPVGFGTEDCARAVEAAMAAEVELQVGFQRRFDPAWRALADAVESGQLGRMVTFRCSHRNAAVPAHDAALGNLFVDVGVHDFDAARWLGGEIIEVFARLAAAPHSASGILLRFASGALGSIDVNRSARYGFECAAEVVGDRATGRIGGGYGPLELLSGGRATTAVPSDHAERHARAYVQELDHFGELVMGRGTPRATGRDALAAMELALAAARSAREGAPVAVGSLVGVMTSGD